MRNFLLIMLSLCLVSCGTPLTSEPLPTPVSVFFEYPFYLQPTAERVIECAIQQHPLSLFLTTSSLVQPSLPGPLLQLQLGGQIPDGFRAYQIGDEGISFIVNSDNPATQLSIERLMEIYTGKMLRWDFEDHPFIELMLYPEEDDLRSFVESTLPGMPRTSFRAEIVSTPNSVLLGVAYHLEGFGYVPSSWVDSLDEELRERVKVLTLEPEFAESLTQPVLALVNESLSPEMQALLGCLQQPED